MDTRYSALKAVARYEGLSDAEQHLITDYSQAPAAAAYNLSLLLRGALSERGHLLDSLQAARFMGIGAGRVLLAGVLADHSQRQNQPNAPLTAADWQRGTDALNAPAVSCERLLALLLGTRRAIAKRLLHIAALAA